jgi:hypothetical protein
MFSSLSKCMSSSCYRFQIRISVCFSLQQSDNSNSTAGAADDLEVLEGKNKMIIFLYIYYGCLECMYSLFVWVCVYAPLFAQCNYRVYYQYQHCQYCTCVNCTFLWLLYACRSLLRSERDERKSRIYGVQWGRLRLFFLKLPMQGLPQS